MALPIIALILDDVEDAIAAISTDAGYQVNVSSVYRQSTVNGMERLPPGPYVVQMTSDDPVRMEELDIFGAEPCIGWMQPVELGLIIRPSDTSTTPIDTALNQFWADVVRAVMADPQWSQRAIDTTVGAPQDWTGPNGEVGRTAIMQISYRVKEADPYQLPANPAGWTAIIDCGNAATTDYTAIIEGNQ